MRLCYCYSTKVLLSKVRKCVVWLQYCTKKRMPLRWSSTTHVFRVSVWRANEKSYCVLILAYPRSDVILSLFHDGFMLPWCADKSFCFIFQMCDTWDCEIPNSLATSHWVAFFSITRILLDRHKSFRFAGLLFPAILYRTVYIGYSILYFCSSLRRNNP